MALLHMLGSTLREVDEASAITAACHICCGLCEMGYNRGVFVKRVANCFENSLASGGAPQHQQSVVLCRRVKILGSQLPKRA